MNSRSKSSSILRTADNPQVKIAKRQLEDLYDKEAKLQILEDRVWRSKPILQTIYEKIKRKQLSYKQQIANLKQEMKKDISLTRQYKQLYQEGLRIMSRNNLVDRFQGQSNYRRVVQRHAHQQRQNNSELQTKIERLKQTYKAEAMDSPSQIQDILKRYRKEGQQNLYITKANIYNQFKQKLGSRYTNGQTLTAKQLSKKLLSNFQQDIQNLSKWRQKSKTQYKPHQGKSELNEHKFKERYLNIQREKLHNT